KCWPEPPPLPIICCNPSLIGAGNTISRACSSAGVAPAKLGKAHPPAALGTMPPLAKAKRPPSQEKKPPPPAALPAAAAPAAPPSPLIAALPPLTAAAPAIAAARPVIAAVLAASAVVLAVSA